MRAIEAFRKMEGLGDRLPVPQAAYKILLQKAGIDQISSHRPLDTARWPASLDEAVALGQSHAGAPGFGEPGIGSLKDTLATAANLNKFGAAAAAKGLRFYVHNHEDEIRTKYSYDIDHNGHPRLVSAWEIVAANTDPRLVHFEVDIHWTRVAFGLDHFQDVLAFLRKYRGRIEILWPRHGGGRRDNRSGQHHRLAGGVRSRRTGGRLLSGNMTAIPRLFESCEDRLAGLYAVENRKLVMRAFVMGAAAIAGLAVPVHAAGKPGDRDSRGRRLRRGKQRQADDAAVMLATFLGARRTCEWRGMGSGMCLWARPGHAGAGDERSGAPPFLRLSARYASAQSPKD